MLVSASRSSSSKLGSFLVLPSSGRILLQVGWRLACLMLLGFISVTSTILSIVSIITLERDRVLYPPAVRERMVSKIAFGSCTAYDYSPQPVWVHGVIPSEPDAWIWSLSFLFKSSVLCLRKSSFSETYLPLV